VEVIELFLKFLISNFRRVLNVVCFLLPIKMEQCSETSAYKIQKPGNYPEESIQLFLKCDVNICLVLILLPKLGVLVLSHVSEKFIQNIV
jgi:hypothetical protein